MATQNQIDSARKNGAKSRGPLTPEGKLRSSANSLKHGLLADAIAIRGEAPAEFAALSARFHAEFRPRTETETHYVETMIICRWRLHRLWETESATLNGEIEKLAPGVGGQTHRDRAAHAFKNLADQSRVLDLLSRYETKFERAFIRAHKALLALRSKPVPDWGHPAEIPAALAETSPEDAKLLPNERPEPSAAKNEILPNEPEPGTPGAPPEPADSPCNRGPCFSLWGPYAPQDVTKLLSFREDSSCSGSIDC